MHTLLILRNIKVLKRNIELSLGTSATQKAEEML
jgi:hypothetical protein